MSQIPEQALVTPLLGLESMPAAAGDTDTWRDEGGFMEAKLMAVAGTMAVMAGLGLIDRLELGVDRSLALSYGKGTLQSTFVMPARECHGGYINQVKGAKATFEAKLHVSSWSIPITAWISEEFNGSMTSQVCNTGIKGNMTTDFKAHTESVNLPEGSLTTVIYRTNPTVNAFTLDEGLAAAQLSGEIGILNTIPGVQIKTMDDIEGYLQGLAQLAANETSATVCGEKAWMHLKEPYKDQIKQLEAARLNNQHATGYEWKPTDITVNAPDAANFTTQYGDLLDQTLQNIKDKGLSIKLPDDKAKEKMSCDDASGPTVLLNSDLSAPSQGPTT